MRVIINADDMGLSKDVNGSIITLHQLGIVSSTTLMANSPNFKQAVDLLSNHPDMGSGVHLCFYGPYQTSTDYKTLIDPHTGSFYNNKEIIKRIRESSVDKDEIFREFCLQVEKVLDHGIRVSHLDTHHNLHLYFPVLSQIIRVARKYDISFIRSQRLNTCIPKSRTNTLYRYIHQLYLNLRLQSVRGYFDPAMDDCPDYKFNLTRLEHMLNSTKGIMEIMLHPLGEDDVETRFFSSKEVLNLFNGHEIINYNQLLR